MTESMGLFAEKAAFDNVGALLFSLVGPEDTGVKYQVSATQATTMELLDVYHPGGEFSSPDGRFNAPDFPPALSDATKALREVMYRENSGTWFSAIFRVTAQGSMTAEFNYADEPEWDVAPDPQVYVADLARFPRDDAHIPDWLRARLEDVASGPGRESP